ncbi:hypothetical protein J1614_011690 [Plenodomus biglobosus]|nr:hypothetical protein J1614_011690 [Plenodomus biglobosus]
MRGNPNPKPGAADCYVAAPGLPTVLTDDSKTPQESNVWGCSTTSRTKADTESAAMRTSKQTLEGVSPRLECAQPSSFQPPPAPPSILPALSSAGHSDASSDLRCQGILNSEPTSYNKARSRTSVKGKHRAVPLLSESSPCSVWKYKAILVSSSSFPAFGDSDEGVKMDSSLPESEFMKFGRVKSHRRSGQNRQRPHVPWTWRMLAEGEMLPALSTRQSSMDLSDAKEDPPLLSSVISAMESTSLCSTQAVYGDETDVKEPTSKTERPPWTRSLRRLVEIKGHAIYVDGLPSEEDPHSRRLRRTESAPDRLGSSPFEFREQQDASILGGLDDNDTQVFDNILPVDISQLVKRLEIVDGLVGASSPRGTTFSILQRALSADSPVDPLRVARCLVGKVSPNSPSTRLRQIILATSFVPFVVCAAIIYGHERSIPPVSPQDLFSGISISAIDLPSSAFQQRSSNDTGSIWTTYEFTPSINATQKYDICVRHKSPTWSLKQEMQVQGLEEVVNRVAERDRQSSPRLGYICAITVAVLGLFWLLDALAQQLLGWLQRWIETGDHRPKAKTCDDHCPHDLFEEWGQLSKVVVGSVAAVAVIVALVVKF